MLPQVPPPGFKPAKPSKSRKNERLTFGEAYRTAATVVRGYNKAATLQALAGIAQELRKLIRG